MAQRTLTVVHVFRAPVGGLFRHVRDLVLGQAKAGLRVGVLCDSLLASEESADALKALQEVCELGVFQTPIQRSIRFSDIAVLRTFRRLFSQHRPDIVHGHGAKGGAISRMVAASIGASSVYTPHGGALHFERGTLGGLFYLGLETVLKRRTDGFIFESIFAQRAYERKVGRIQSRVQVIYNGLHPSEFEPLPLSKNAADFLFIGELRPLKGIEVLIQAASLLKQSHQFRLLMVGSGCAQQRIISLIDELNLADTVRLMPPMHPAREAFQLARCIVLPSLAESMPYAVLEALAAGKPLITTRVGGIPEIYGDYDDDLIPPGCAEALAGRMQTFLDNGSLGSGLCSALRQQIEGKFTYQHMNNNVIGFYQQICENRASLRCHQTPPGSRIV